MKLFIDHEVVSKYLKALFSLLWIDLCLYTFQCVNDDISYAIIDDLVKVDINSILVFKLLASLFEAKLVALFKFTVIGIFLLNRIVGEVDGWKSD